MGLILGKENKRTEPNLNTVFENPGFFIISRTISLFLDQDTLLSCRLVSQSFRKRVNDPHIWIEKLDNKGQSREFHDAWIDLLRQIEKGSTLENEVSRCLMHWYYRQRTWTEYAKNGIMPINIAAFYGYLEIVKTISSHHENPNAPMPSGWTPIHLAANNGYTDIVKILVDKVEDLNTSNINGWTPIQLAARNGHTEIVKMLADKVENSHAPRPDGWTPFTLAFFYGHFRTSFILLTK